MLSVDCSWNEGSETMRALLEMLLPVAHWVLLDRCSQISVVCSMGLDRRCLRSCERFYPEIIYLRFKESYLHVTWGSHMRHRRLSGDFAMLLIQWIKKGIEDVIQTSTLTSGGNPDILQKALWSDIILGWVKIYLKLPAWFLWSTVYKAAQCWFSAL